jgi:Na+-driven multidrug efflux pump
MTALTAPLILESFFRMPVSSEDAVTLSSYSASAVAGGWLVFQRTLFIQIVFNAAVCAGASVALGQYVGANRLDDARRTAQASAVMIFAAGIGASLMAVFGAPASLGVYRLENEAREGSEFYLLLFGALGSTFTAVNMPQASVPRSYGLATNAMSISVAANPINSRGRWQVSLRNRRTAFAMPSPRLEEPPMPRRRAQQSRVSSPKTPHPLEG